jgi:hypothetical protein
MLSDENICVPSDMLSSKKVVGVVDSEHWLKGRKSGWLLGWWQIVRSAN